MKIGVVLVTFNRLAELKKTIRLYEQQTLKPQYILVVDNHSNDGTADFLAEWAVEESAVEHKVLTLPENTGGSGGFHAGMAEAADLDADWIWLADDDAYVHVNAFEEFAAFLDKGIVPVENIAALSAAVCNKHGFARGHRCRLKKTLAGLFEVPVESDDYSKPFFEIDFYSFVGAVIKKEVLLKAGLPRKEFFIYHDDYEHAERVRKYGKILCIPAAKVQHEDNSNVDRDASWRDYYSTRNILIMYREHYGKIAFCTRTICRLLTALRSGNPEKVKVFRAAIADAKNNVTGLHPVYRPGWQPEKKYPK